MDASSAVVDVKEDTVSKTDALSTSEDPLIAALPPNTDYISYLTILEYTLTPENLPTLNRLLTEDDGTLASEIGWDLLKLVLPIFRVDAPSAKTCLDIIARRGNPREVIVRVAEELESLGRDETDDEADPIEQDDKRTFVGEAPHVHLGNMTLAGMPPSAEDSRSKQVVADAEDDPDTALQEVKLRALLSMLGDLHPRIKTQYPSRFLATSLPAALGAYRNLSMDTDSTIVFLNILKKLAGKQRPSLPPRVSSADLLRSAPLPDPESKTDTANIAKSPSGMEVTIIKRLLQAVLLEIIDEYTTASTEPQAPVTARLRAAFEPETLTSSRKVELENLVNNENAKCTDSIRSKFVDIARDLGLDVPAEVVRASKPTAKDEAEAEPEHEYPTSPSEIPFSTTGILLLYSVILQTQTSRQASLSSIDLDAILEVLDQQYEADTRLRHSAPAIDNLLSILYLLFCTETSNSFDTPTAISEPKTRTLTRSDTFVTESQTVLLATHNILRHIFTTIPDQDLRDNAYHIASHLLHGHCRSDVRIKIIRSLLETSNATAVSPIHEAQNGSLKAIGVEWLKDEIFPTPSVLKMMTRLPESSERGLSRDVIGELGDLVFPMAQLPIVPGVDDSEAQQEQYVEAFAADVTFFISSLNLLCLLAKQHGNEQEIDVGMREVWRRARGMVKVLEGWRDYLNARLASGGNVNTTQDIGMNGVEGVSLPDLFALDDAVSRAQEALADDA